MTCVQIAFIDIYLTFTSVLLQPSDGKHSTSIILIQSGCLSNIAPPTFNLSRDLLTQHASVCGYPGLFFKKINSQEEKWWRSGHLSLLWFCEVGRKQTGLDNKTELTRLNGSEPSLMSLVTPAASECLQRAAESYMCFLQDAIQAIQLKVSQYFVCLEHRKFLWNQKETAGNSSPETVTCWVNALVQTVLLYSCLRFPQCRIMLQLRSPEPSHKSSCSDPIKFTWSWWTLFLDQNELWVKSEAGFYPHESTSAHLKKKQPMEDDQLTGTRGNSKTFWVYFTFRDLLWVIWREALLRTDLSVVLNHRRLEFQF